MMVKFTDAVAASVLDTIITPCLAEGESYADRSRKLACIFLAVLVSNALFLGLPIGIVAGVFDPNIPMYLMASAFVMTSICTSFIPYTYMRLTKTMPQLMVDFQMWSTVPTVVCGVLTVHQGAILFALSVASVVGVVLRVRGWFLFTMFTIVSCTVNELIGNYGDRLPALHSAMYREQSLSERIMFLVGNLVGPGLCIAVGLNRLMSEFVERADQADAAIAMSLAVADKLRRYDTEGVGAILAANEGVVDESLLEAFAGIQRNLEEYRPHIPDYVIATTTSDGPTETMQEYESTHESEGDYNSVMSDDTDTTRADMLSVRQAFIPSFNSEGKSSPPSPSTTSMSSVSRAESPSKATIKPKHIDISSGISSRSPVESTTAQQGCFVGRATTVFVRFSCGGGSHHRFSGTVVASLNFCVESAAKHAKIHNGALQYMQGCGLMVSFNAASRTNSHEAKASAFALALKQDVEGFVEGGATLVMHASVVSSKVMSFFAGNKGQLMLTLVGNYLHKHASIHHFLAKTVGAEASCVVAVGTVAATVDTLFSVRPIGAVGPATEPPGKVFKVFELQSKRADAGDLEWMYQLDEHSKADPNAVLKQVIAAVEAGDPLDDAQSEWVSSPGVDGALEDAVLAKCVKERLRLHIDGGRKSCHLSDIAVYSTPVIMW